MDNLRGDLSAVEEAGEEILRRQRPFLWRTEYWLLAGVGLLLAVFAGIIYFAGFQPSALLRYGYAGVFILNFLGAASMVLPIPGTAAVFGAGGVLQPIAGIPVPVLVGLVAGLGEALGEFTGYATGVGGRVVLEERAFYRRVVRFMERYGVLAMFVLAAIPNPFFDIAGVAAGATKMPVWRFFIAVLLGKIFKGMYVATAGFIGIGILRGFFS
jgi:membrane protein YqaA with SNARE-associated domain